MRRKSERTATKKAKTSPEKKVEKVKRTRGRRRKQSSSSENESGDEGSPVQEVEVVEEQDKIPPSTPVKKDDSPEDAQEQVWHVKATEASGDVGEIQKLKICLARPPSTPERVDKSPRSRRKHSRATSSSDSPSVDSVDEKRKSGHRSKKSRDSKDESDKNDSQEEPEVEPGIHTASDEPDSEVSQSTDSQHHTSDETPMSTTNEESKPTESETPVDGNNTQEKESQQNESSSEAEAQDNSAADTTVVSPKMDNQESTGDVNTTARENQECERERSVSVEKSEVLEIHAEETKCESSEPQHKEEEDSVKDESDKSIEQDEASSERKVSISEDKKDESNTEESGENDTAKTNNETDVVENTEKTDSDENKRTRNVSTDSDKDKDESKERYRNRDIHRSDSVQSAQEDTVHIEQAPPIVVTRKRKWGSRPKVTTQKSITISTDILKDIIPDVKPVEFDEVIEEKKHRRIEVVEKLERPVLPKIVIDNTHNVEQNKKEQEDAEHDKVKELRMSANRRISIVKEEDSIMARPPSPPKHKQSNILYITNLVRPFTLPQLKNLLQRTGRIVDSGFWIDRIKSKCFVKYENEDQAVETRHALHGVTWPVSNPKTLQVDFSTQEAFDKAMQNEDTDGTQTSSIPGTVEDWLREQDMRRDRGEIDKPWERKAAMREWDMGKNEKEKEKDKLRRDERLPEKRRHRTPSPEPARKFKKKEEEAPAKLLDDLFRKTKTTPCIYWLPLSAETIAIKEEQRRQHMAEHERRLQELRRTQHRRHYSSAHRYSVEVAKLVLYLNGELKYFVKMARWWYVLAVVVMSVTADNPFTIDDFVSGRFAQRGFNGTWISDTEFTFTKPEEPGIFVYDASDDSIREFFVNASVLEALGTENPILSRDRQYILAPSDVQRVYRYSTTARFALYEIETQHTTLIADHEPLQLCIFGANHALAYVLNNNVYYLPSDVTEAIPLTFDGNPGDVFNGHTDWVYEEDVMYTGQATWFSTQGSYLAFASFDDREVETYSYYYYVNMTEPDDLYPELVHLKYPKVNHRNPTVRLRVVNLVGITANNISYIDLPAPVETVTDDHILGGVQWTTDNEIAALWLNRRQNSTVLKICNIAVTPITCQDEYRTQPNGWVPIGLPRFSSDGSYFLSLRWSLEQTDGNIWQHLFLSMRIDDDIVSSSITPQHATVNNFVGMNEEFLEYYYTTTVPDTPWQSQVRVVGANDGCLSCNLVLPDGGPCTWATATASHGGSYLTITCSSSNEISATFIIDTRTRESIRLWEDNAIVRERLVGKTRPGSMIFTVPLQNGFPAPVRLHLPPGLDFSDTNTKYPLVFYVYSGPNTNTVFDTFTVGYHSYLATSRNIIYMVADGRGSGLKGQEILYSLNNALGTVEVEDHFVILRQVLQQFPVIDQSRIGIWGHSYGGYATLLTLLHDDEHLFSCGVSGAPVTSWLYYNTMYTERYMGRPTEEDNLKGYEAGDVTLLAKKLEGHDFYIMHGNADDNVHYQNAAKLMTALQELNIPFEQMSYPDEAHSLAGVNMHRYHAMDRYWNRCLRLRV
ncbi:uncharacterized protein LOC113233504 [Hyposmocoma kahamanoa]|uniref:uncharacterized protein LOC113233504 n=1 Tax=Hyposmocoma kahamanoa TaxID=1477025 RepID=UPI000E6D625B|nr:uncharacterized protein LOC113233504 [Hyposmocoma kahamanoa]